jgi:hypothetical protein
VTSHMTAPGLDIRWRSFRVPRRGHRVEECEDACAAAVERGRLAVAVADGAAESAHSGLWARLLVDEFVAGGPDQPAWPAWIAPLQARWEELVQLPSGAEPLPWYLEERYRQGAFATFLGLSVDHQGWDALAVGDSCLFQLRDGKLSVTFPLSHSGQFDNSPWLIGSRTSPDEVPSRQVLRTCGDCRPGDRLWLMTDALSRWFLSRAEAGKKPWRELEELLDSGDERFAGWVERLRASKKLRNDDTTLVAVCV